MAPPADLLHRLHGQVSACGGTALEQGRRWLVIAGQIEQAVRDGGGSEAIQAVTDRAAELFLALLNGEETASAWRRLLEAAAGTAVDAAPAEVRVPEGFAWYALYPDSYAAVAKRWAAARRRGEAVLVIGLRSIGTSLSAVVAAALAREGITARRFTVRPEGDPFARRVALPRGIGRTDAVIVVDEGPGLSGSSMSGVAEALLAQGVSEEAISFFPGHGRGPGAMASPGARRWWTARRCWTGEPPDMPSKAHGLDWIFGGFAAVNAELETLAEVKRARQLHLAEKRLACPCPAVTHGWLGIATEGEALKRCDLSQALVQKTLATYIGKAARPCHDASVIHDALGRIAAALEAEIPPQVRASCRGLPLAGDGRLWPGEWLRCDDGRVLKRNATGTDCEHSWAGAQGVLWDVAGALAEWEMDESMRGCLLDALAREHGMAADPLALAFHEAGYCCLQRARAEHEGDSARAMRFAALMQDAMARMEALQ